MKIRKSKELANLLRVTESAISRWISAGMPCTMADGRMTYEFDLDEVLEWVVKRSPRHQRFIEQLIQRWSAAPPKDPQ